MPRSPAKQSAIVVFRATKKVVYLAPASSVQVTNGGRPKPANPPPVNKVHHVETTNVTIRKRTNNDRATITRKVAANVVTHADTRTTPPRAAQPPTTAAALIPNLHD